eukprot:CAMPEP_0181169020 /NCGR_PEP_ID=MMETSP1096-20121128/590_1 /TAXON_ID=156174 ORGANISM="Chrysochromulina ericina, Strain CCMP281" /NCGR_SAMPLE_ID=MMETSP1096 /ASSEMBLY_ACC=CAM_ASM_000453 /LENGTH=80 /DNA_ID=CAMNT_0023256447 /DNA_START=83 /DNA_END=325 /DNA_ORIENTATION=-
MHLPRFDADHRRGRASAWAEDHSVDAALSPVVSPRVVHRILYPVWPAGPEEISGEGLAHVKRMARQLRGIDSQKASRRIC